MSNAPCGGSVGVESNGSEGRDEGAAGNGSSANMPVDVSDKHSSSNINIYVSWSR